MGTSLLLVGGYEIDYRGLTRMLEGEGLVVGAHTPSGRAALAALATRIFDLVLLDVSLSDLDPVELIADLRSVAPQQTILLFAMQENASASIRAASLGASGLILKSESDAAILAKLRAAANGSATWSREDLRRLSVSASSIASGTEYEVPLTHREGEVLQHLSEGRTNKQIAVALGISYETVKEHVQHILHKVGVIDRTQAAIWAVRRRLI